MYYENEKKKYIKHTQTLKNVGNLSYSVGIIIIVKKSWTFGAPRSENYHTEADA